MNFLVFGFAILFAALSFLNIKKAILLTLVFLPTYLLRFELLNIPLTALELMVLIIFAVWVIKNRKKISQPKSWKAPDFWREALLIIAAASIGVAVNFGSASLGVWKAYFVEPILFFLVITQTFKGKDGAKALIAALGVSAFFTALFAVYQKFSGNFIGNPFWAAEETRRVVSWFSYPNAVGLFLAPLTMLLAGRFFSFPVRNNFRDSLKRIAYLLAIIISLLAILFAQSEGALIALAFSSWVFLFFSGKKSRYTAVTIAVIGIIGIASFSPIKHYSTQKATLMDLSGQIRRQQWTETWQMLNNGRLLTGAGLSGYQSAIKPFHQAGIFVKNDDPNWLKKVLWNKEYRDKVWQPVEIYFYPHNIILNFWSEIGFFGLLFFLWLIAKQLFLSFRGATKIKDRERFLVLGAGTAMTAIIVHGLVDVPYFKNDLAIIFWVIIALTVILIKPTEKV
ncbi:MAG: O-antigen ligase family protein [Candidatus Falkowbacteria bacterium]|nr:O-antigen ligase family protein [Candidatus Falkowbacteria bacterium]